MAGKDTDDWLANSLALLSLQHLLIDRSSITIAITRHYVSLNSLSCKVNMVANLDI